MHHFWFAYIIKKRDTLYIHFTYDLTIYNMKYSGMMTVGLSRSYLLLHETIFLAFSSIIVVPINKKCKKHTICLWLQICGAAVIVPLCTILTTI